MRAAWLVGLLLLIPLVPAPASAAPPALFFVGAAVRDITPATPQYPGGYGTDRISTGVDAPLEVRAFSVTNATGATVMWAEVDTQGYFSGYQEGPYGTFDARYAVAAATGVPADHIAIASSHSHAAPTIMGIWGPTDINYLRLVHDQTVAALTAAFDAREPANLFVGRADASDLIGQGIGYGDMMPGWPVDGTLSTLRAVSPEGRDVATFINFGDHADIVAKSNMSPDWLGPARDYVQARLGGTVVVAEGTLGHQETPIEDNRGGDPYQQIVRFGDLVGARAMASLAHAEPITNDIVDADLEYFAVPITNPALLALDAGVSLRGTPGQDAVDNYPIDRSLLPPYAAPPALATWAGVLRFGDELLFTLPGEAFPEVAKAIRDHAGSGASAASVGADAPAGASSCKADFDLGLAHDQLGYYWLSWEEANAAPVGDFLIFNVNPAMGDLVARVDLLAATKVGCATTPFADAPQPHGTGTIDGNVPLAVQGLAFPDAVAAGDSITFEGMPQNGGDALAWDFGDGATGAGQRVAHAYAAPGDYTATIIETNGAESASWTVPVHVFPQATATISVTALGAGSYHFAAGLTGGSGAPLQALWDFGDGSTGAGLTVDHAFSPGTHAIHVRVADASGLIGDADQTIVV